MLLCWIAVFAASYDRDASTASLIDVEFVSVRVRLLANGVKDDEVFPATRNATARWLPEAHESRCALTHPQVLRVTCARCTKHQQRVVVQIRFLGTRYRDQGIVDCRTEATAKEYRED